MTNRNVSLTIFSDLNTIVKVRCVAIGCRHNVTNTAPSADLAEVACNLKHITVEAEGKCANFERVGK